MLFYLQSQKYYSVIYDWQWGKANHVSANDVCLQKGKQKLKYVFIYSADLYREVLPGEAPPSYRGQAVKYSYKITIGTQRVNSPIKLLRVPLRVLVVSGVSDSSACGDSEDLMPTNPFLETQQKDTPLEIALQMLQVIKIFRAS